MHVIVSACNNKQRLNKDKCRCECKELIDKGRCDNGFIWNPSNCECDKSWDVGEYLDYRNWKCRKKLGGKLVEECSENTDENQLIYNGAVNDYEKSIQFFYGIHSIIYHCFLNTHWH